MMVPRVMPMTATKRLYGVIAMWKPRRRFSIPIAYCPSHARERALGHGNENPLLKEENRGEWKGAGDRQHGEPGVPTDPAHVEAGVERRRDVEPERQREDDERHRGPEHLEHGTELLAPDERFGVDPARRLAQDQGTGGDQ